MEKFSFWELFKRQWSWKNDRESLILNLFLATLTTVTYHFCDSIHVSPAEEYWKGVVILFTIIFVNMFVFYQMLKMLGMIAFCSLVTYLSNKGDTEAMQMYNEALTWRQ
jgi:hypothetical protein